MKIILTKSQYNQLLIKENVQDEIKKNILKLKNVDEVNNYFTELNNTYSEKSSKLVLIFPGELQYTIVASAIYLSKINAQVFKSINDCINILNKLAEQGKKYEQIYIGSHGGGLDGLLYTINERESTSIFLSGIIESLNKIIIPNKTNIVFSACGGADNLFPLKEIAIRTNTYTYGSEGRYDWIDNKSEKGFWTCSPSKKINEPSYGCKKVNSIPFTWL